MRSHTHPTIFSITVLSKVECTLISSSVSRTNGKINVFVCIFHLSFARPTNFDSCVDWKNLSCSERNEIKVTVNLDHLLIPEKNICNLINWNSNHNMQVVKERVSLWGLGHAHLPGPHQGVSLLECRHKNKCFQDRFCRSTIQQRSNSKTAKQKR